MEVAHGSAWEAALQIHKMMTACHSRHQDPGQTVVPSEGHGRCHVVAQSPESVPVLHLAAARWHTKLPYAGGLLQKGPDQAVHHNLQVAEDHLRGTALSVEDSHCHSHRYRRCRRHRSCRLCSHQHNLSVPSHTLSHKLAHNYHYSHRPGCSHLVPNAVVVVLDGAEAVAAAAKAAWCGDGASAAAVKIGAVVACQVDAPGASEEAADRDVLEADQGNLVAANHVVASCHAVAVGQDCPNVVVHQRKRHGQRLDVGLRPHFGLPQRAHGHLPSHDQSLGR